MAGIDDKIIGIFGTTEGKPPSIYDPQKITFGDLEVVKSEIPSLNVSGANHGTWYVMTKTNPLNNPLVINVGKSSVTVNGQLTVRPGTIMLFTQDTDSALIFNPLEGVTIKASGQLMPYGRNSTVGLVSINETEWIFIGDVKPFGES